MGCEALRVTLRQTRFCAAQYTVIGLTLFIRFSEGVNAGLITLQCKTKLKVQLILLRWSTLLMEAPAGTLATSFLNNLLSY